nr:uncharacterized mitochondrial protein AtMg00810-like [Tanacetum cinerariifolium]
ANLKESHLIAVKRIFKYLKGTPSLGMWYPKYLGFKLKGYSDSDYAGCNMDKKVPQVEFTFKEIAFTTNNEVALLYPSHPNKEYFKGVSNYISKCCLKEAFTRALNQYKEYLSEFWYTAKVLPDFKIWVSTPTGEVRGEIGITTFRNALRTQYLCHSSMYVPPPFITTETKSSSAMDTSPSHPSPPTPVVGEMHKEAQQAAYGPTSLGDTSEDGAYPQLSSVKLEDLADILKDTRSAFVTIDSLIIVSDVSEEEENAENDKDTKDTSKELEQEKVIAEAEGALMKAKPLYPDINQLTKLLELPAEFLDLPHLASSVQEKLMTLDSLPVLLKTVTNTLNRFATLVKNASGATTTSVPLADKATASPAEKEKDADTNLRNKLVGQLKSLKNSKPVTYSWLNEER